MDIIEQIDFILQEKIKRKGLSKTFKKKKVTKKTFPKSSFLNTSIYKRLQASNKLSLAMQFGSAKQKKKVRNSICRKYPDLQICKETRYKKDY